MTAVWVTDELEGLEPVTPRRAELVADALWLQFAAPGWLVVRCAVCGRAPDGFEAYDCEQSLSLILRARCHGAEQRIRASLLELRRADRVPRVRMGGGVLATQWAFFVTPGERLDFALP